MNSLLMALFSSSSLCLGDIALSSSFTLESTKTCVMEKHRDNLSLLWKAIRQEISMNTSRVKVKNCLVVLNND